MTGIDRPTIVADLVVITAYLFEALATVVAGIAERLQLAIEEAVPIAVMRLDVISDRCRNSKTVCCAHSAKWFDHALSARDPSPSFKLIPVTMTTIGHVRDRRLVATNLCGDDGGTPSPGNAGPTSLASLFRSQKETCQGGSETRCTAGFPLLLGNPREVNGLPWQECESSIACGKGTQHLEVQRPFWAARPALLARAN
jgi:hypothetical protein